MDFEALQRASEYAASERVPKEQVVVAQTSTSGFPSGKLFNGTNTNYAETTTKSLAAAAENEPHEGQTYDPIPTTPIEAMQHPAIQFFQEVCGHIQGAAHYQVVIETMDHFRREKGEKTVEYLRPFWLAWSGRKRRFDGQSYDPGSLTWLAEWALNGTIPPEAGGSHTSHRPRNVPALKLTAADLAAAGRINRRRGTKMPPVP